MDRARLRQLLDAHGRDAISFLAFDRGLELLALGDDACIAYHDTGSAWVTVGGPIGPRARLDGAYLAAREAAARAGRRLVWFGVETRPRLDWLAALHVGEQPIWDPADWSQVLAGSRSLREQLRRARAKGVRIRHFTAAEVQADAALLGKVRTLVERWFDSRPMAPMGFLVRVAPFERDATHGLLVAEVPQSGGTTRVVGILTAVPIPARDGLLFQDVLRDPDAPNGTVELLFDAAMRRAAAEGHRFATFGLAPLANVPSPVLAAIREVSAPLYDFDGLRRFKAKLRPGAWRPVHVLHDRQLGVASAVLEVLRAFAGRPGLWAFGIRTLRHRAPTVAAVLAALLVPWTAFLMLVDGRHFPSETVRHAWVVWDVLLGAGLTLLATRWRPWLARSLACAALLDLGVGTVQALVHNARHLPGHPSLLVVECLLIVLSLAAPAFAGWFLWTSARR